MYFVKNTDIIMLDAWFNVLLTAVTSLQASQRQDCL